MTPERAIAMLDKQIADHGQQVAIRQGNSATGEVPARAFVRGMKPDEIAGAITQSDRMTVFSPTDTDTSLPKRGGFVVVDGAPAAIIGSPDIVRINGVVVRVNVAVKG